MSAQKLEPDKIGTPFQLLAATMVFIVLLDGAFLSSAAVLDGVPGASITLVIAAVVYPPVVLTGIFVLQTRFRDMLLGDDAYLELKRKVGDLRQSVDASGFDVTRIPGTSSAAGLSSDATDAIENRADELERAMGEGMVRWSAPQRDLVAEAARELGRAALAQGRWREGADRLAEYLAVKPDDWAEWFAQGTAFANAREGATTDTLSVLAYTRALESKPADADDTATARMYAYRAGVLKRDRGKWQLAEDDLERARELAQDGTYESDDIHYNWAAILAMRGEADAAVRELVEISDPWYFEAVAEHEDDYFANLKDRPDFRQWIDRKAE